MAISGAAVGAVSGKNYTRVAGAAVDKAARMLASMMAAEEKEMTADGAASAMGSKFTHAEHPTSAWALSIAQSTLPSYKSPGGVVPKDYDFPLDRDT